MNKSAVEPTTPPWEVQEIHGERILKSKLLQKEYFVQWKGREVEENTWERANFVQDIAPAVILEWDETKGSNRGSEHNSLKAIKDELINIPPIRPDTNQGPSVCESAFCIAKSMSPELQYMGGQLLKAIKNGNISPNEKSHDSSHDSIDEDSAGSLVLTIIGTLHHSVAHVAECVARELDQTSNRQAEAIGDIKMQYDALKEETNALEADKGRLTSEVTSLVQKLAESEEKNARLCEENAQLLQGNLSLKDKINALKKKPIADLNSFASFVLEKRTGSSQPLQPIAQDFVDKAVKEIEARFNCKLSDALVSQLTGMAAFIPMAESENRQERMDTLD